MAFQISSPAGKWHRKAQIPIFGHIYADRIVRFIITIQTPLDHQVWTSSWTNAFRSASLVGAGHDTFHASGCYSFPTSVPTHSCMNLTSLYFECPNFQTLGAHAKPFLPYRIAQLLLGWSNKSALTQSDVTCSGKLASQIESWMDIVKVWF